MRPESRQVRQVGLISQSAMAIVIIKLIACIDADSVRANLRAGGRIKAGQVLGYRVEAQEIAFGVCERKALTPVPGRLIVKSNSRRDAAAFSALIGVGEKSPRGAGRAEP